MTIRKISLFFAVITLVSCKTQNIYLFNMSNEKVAKDTAVLFIRPYNKYENHFAKEFQKADSIFNIMMKASHEAAKSAFEKTKHKISH